MTKSKNFVRDSGVMKRLSLTAGDAANLLI